MWVKYQKLLEKWWNRHDYGIYPWNIGITLEIMGILGMNDHNMVEQGGTVKKMGFNQWLVKKCVWNSAKDTPYFRASLVWRNTHVDMGCILSQRLEILNAPWFHMCEAKRAYMLHQTCQCFNPTKSSISLWLASGNSMAYAEHVWLVVSNMNGLFSIIINVVFIP